MRWRTQRRRAPATPVKEVTTASFRADVLTRLAAPAGAGRLLGAVVRPVQAARPGAGKGGRRLGGKVALVKMNIDEHPQIAGQLGIQSIPAVIAFDRGQPVDGFVGALPESQVRGFIERLVGPLNGGPTSSSPRPRRPPPRATRPAPRRSTREILAEDESNLKAIGGLAKLHVDGGRPRRGQGGARDAPAPAPGKEPDPAIAAAAAAVHARRAGLERRRARAARGGGRRESRRPSGALRSRGGALGQGRAGRGGRSAARDHPARPQVERRGGAQAVVAVFRSLGPDGPGRRSPPAANCPRSGSEPD